jgi:hypothetical protein
MRAPSLVLRCYAENLGHQWQAFCLDLNLAAQGDTFPDVRRKLDAMICEYVTDAVVGQDKEHAEQLLTRRAPLYFWWRYYTIWFTNKIGRARMNVRKLFTETMPLTPNCQNH